MGKPLAERYWIPISISLIMFGTIFFSIEDKILFLGCTVFAFSVVVLIALLSRL